MRASSNIKLSRHNFTLARPCSGSALCTRAPRRSSRSAHLVDLRPLYAVRSATDMRLSSLRSWLGATDNDLILGPSLAWSAPARLSRRYRTHAAWRRNLFSAPVACAFVGPVTSHRSLEYPSRRLHSHHGAREGAEPHPASLAPAGMVTGLQARKIRARQLAETKISETAPRTIARSRHRERRSSKAPGSKNAKLDKVLWERRTRRRERKAEPAEAQKEDDQDSVLDSSLTWSDVHFAYWGPATTASAVHVHALQKAHNAAQKAEQAANLAARAIDAASVAKGSHDEEDAIRKADYASTQAEIAASAAKQAEMHAAEEGERYETVRAELLASKEAQPIFWDIEGSFKDSTISTGHRLRALIRSSCQICQGAHPLAKCQVLFDALTPGMGESSMLKLDRRLFRDRMSIDKDFREAISYILSKLFVSRGQTREVVPLERSVTDDAPASAISESSAPYNWSTSAKA